jgi:hypothetical protein
MFKKGVAFYRCICPTSDGGGFYLFYGQMPKVRARCFACGRQTKLIAFFEPCAEEAGHDWARIRRSIMGCGHPVL